MSARLFGIRVTHPAFGAEGIRETGYTERAARREAARLQVQSGHGWIAEVTHDGRVIARRAHGARRFRAVEA